MRTKTLSDDELQVEAETESLFDEVLSAHADLSARYGTNYSVALRTHEILDKYRASPASSRTLKDWKDFHRQLGLALSDINRCAFSSHSLLGLKRRLDGLSARAQDELRDKPELIDNLRSSAVVMNLFCTQPGWKFLSTEVDDPAMAAKLFEVERRVHEMSDGELRRMSWDEANYVNLTLSGMFDDFFGGYTAKGETRPFGNVYTTQITVKLSQLSRAIGRQANPEWSGVLKALQRSSAHFSAVCEAIGVEYDRVPRDRLWAQSSSGTAMRRAFDLVERGASVTDLVEATQLAQELDQTFAGLFNELMRGEWNAWARGRFVVHLGSLERQAARQAAGQE